MIYRLPWWRGRALNALVTFAPIGVVLIGGPAYRRWATDMIRRLLDDPDMPKELRNR